MLAKFEENTHRIIAHIDPVTIFPVKWATPYYHMEHMVRGRDSVDWRLIC